jgi:hypothetical protein
MLRCALVCFVLLTPVMAAATPASVPIQGTLLDSGGNPVNGTKSITFNIYTVLAGGAAIYTETQATVAVEFGVFTAYIGDVTPLSLATFDGRPLWLGVTVGTDAEMTPRLRFGTVPYAAFAEATGGGRRSRRGRSCSSLSPHARRAGRCTRPRRGARSSGCPRPAPWKGPMSRLAS